MKYILFLSILFYACVPGAEHVKSIETHSNNGGMSNLSVNQNGEVILSWIEFIDEDTDALFFSRLSSNGWANPVELQRGSDWFVNWADFPATAQIPNTDILIHHWLQKSDQGTYDYDIKVAGFNFSDKKKIPSQILHQDAIAAEHGFVSLLPFQDYVFATWLDGRFTKLDDHKHDKENHNEHTHSGGSMTLRSAIIDKSFNFFNDIEMDARVCDCCQTDALITNAGPVVVYRDRTEAEIRDISIVRYIDGAWTKPKAICNDNWKIAGCPVNGPAVSGFEDKLAVVWYTSPEGIGPTVKGVVSTNNGESFEAPFIISNQNPLGRVDVIFPNENNIIVSYLEMEKEQAFIIINKYDLLGNLIENVDKILTSDQRASGFPVLEKFADQFVLTWTQIENDTSKVMTKIYAL